jgi:DNA-binding MarR family transcriptional regulator/GNAT superfamily N-acetyltransferase
MDAALMQQVRSFNRTVTQTIGALHNDYLGRDRPLGESRLLFEIGEHGATVGALRDRLDLDSGYVSRLLRSLEKQALVTTKPSPADRRVRIARLTGAGKEEVKGLNRDSDRLAQSILAPLNDTQRCKLASAMVEVERLLTASAVTVCDEPASSPDAQTCLAQYFRELGERFESGFEPARALPAEPAEFAPPKGAFVVMRLHGRPVACGGFKPFPPDAAYLKRMWVAPEARGLGVGRRLLQALEERAGAAGYRKTCLETNRTLKEAQRLYRASGYAEVPPFNDEPYAHNWFEKVLNRVPNAARLRKASR